MSQQMNPTDIQIEGELKSLIDEYANKSGRSVSEIVKDLAWVGIGAEKIGGLRVTGPIGINRPFANFEIGGEPVRISVRLDDAICTALKTFNTSKREALRNALRLGFIVLKPEQVQITGIFGVLRPFSEAKTPKIEDRSAKAALERLRKIDIK